MRRESARRCGYALGRTLEAIRPSYRFDVTCQGTVQATLTSALESTGLEDAVRDAVSLGGDADALESIAEAVGEALHGPLERLVEVARARFHDEAMDIADAFYRHAPGDAMASGPATISAQVRSVVQ